MTELINHLPVLLIDGSCSLCNASAKLILRYERNPALRFAALDSAMAAALLQQFGKRENLPDSVILIDHDGMHVKSRALIRIGKLAGGGLRLLTLLGIFPTGLADWLYDVVARNRKKWFGTAIYCSNISLKHRHRFLDL